MKLNILFWIFWTNVLLKTWMKVNWFTVKLKFILTWEKLSQFFLDFFSVANPVTMPMELIVKEINLIAFVKTLFMLFFEICELCISFSSCMYIGFYLTNTRQENFHYLKNIIALTSFCIMLWILGYNPLVNGYNTQDNDLFCQINGKK